jgi:pimeloyl-ACP methyl ester carboxylesterase
MLVALPGMLGTGAVFGALHDVTEPGEVRVLQPDRPELDAAVAAVLALDVDGLTLVGHSLGGIVALAAAARAPERVRRLVVLATNAAAPRPEQRATWAAWAAATRDGRFAETAAAVTDTSAPGRWHDLALAMAVQCGPRVFVDQLALQATRVDLHGALGRVRAPAEVVCGSADPLCPPAFHERIAAALPAARLRVVPGAGHFVPLEVDAPCWRELLAR